MSTTVMLSSFHAARSLGVTLVMLAASAPSPAGPVLAIDHALKVSLIDVRALEAGVVTFTAVGGPDGDKAQPQKKPLADFAAFLPPDVWTPGEDRPVSWRASSSSGGAGGGGGGGGVGGGPLLEWGARVASAAERAGLGVVELVDGQKLIGSLETAGEAAPADSMVWSHRSMGRLVLPLDRVRRVRMEGPSVSMPDAFDASQDIVLLTNGDTVSGLIEKITDKEIWSSPKGSGGKGDPIRTPLERVCELRLANPAPAKAAVGQAVVWLEDGSIVACDPNSLSMGGEADRVLLGGIGAEIRGRPLGTAASAENVKLGRLRAMAIDASRFVPLATVPVAAQAPSSDRLFGSPAVVGSLVDAPLGLTDVLLPGPMSVEWALPAGADRLSGWLQLPESCRDWGACRVTLLLGDRELFAHALSASENVVAFNVSLADDPAKGGKPVASRLKVVVESGERGPVQDQVLLRRVVVGIGGPAAKAEKPVPLKGKEPR